MVDIFPSTKRGYVVVTLLVTVILPIYYVLGYAVLPELLIPFGCAGMHGDSTIVYTDPSFNISSDVENDTVVVTSNGRDNLTRKNTHAVLIETATAGDNRTYQWNAVGGTFPIENGDSVTVRNPFGSSHSLSAGDEILVVWDGVQIDPQPNYCPGGGDWNETKVVATHTVQ